MQVSGTSFNRWREQVLEAIDEAIKDKAERGTGDVERRLAEAERCTGDVERRLAEAEPARATSSVVSPRPSARSGSSPWRTSCWEKRRGC
jgi:hypothetical protein